MPFLPPNQQRQSTKGIYVSFAGAIEDLATKFLWGYLQDPVVAIKNSPPRRCKVGRILMCNPKIDFWGLPDTPSPIGGNLARKTALFRARFRLDRCVTSPLLGQKSLTLPNLEYLGFHTTPHQTGRNLARKSELRCALPREISFWSVHRVQSRQ